jgi:MFS family permease
MIAAISSAWALFLGMGLLMTGSGLLGTLLGVRATFEGFGTTVTGLLMSAYFLGFLAGSTLTPGLVARVGHVRVFGALASLASSAVLIHAVQVDPVTWTAMRILFGFCYAGLYVVAESWLNEISTNRTRGQILSIYMIISMGGMAIGQGLLNTADPESTRLFIVISVLVSVALVPMLLSGVSTPPIRPAAGMPIRELYRISPLGIVGMMVGVAAWASFFSMGAVYAAQIGLSVAEISAFMAAMLIGAVVLQWPIGRLSDIFDRRTVFAITALLVAVASGLIAFAEDGPRLWLYLAAALFGGVAVPLYSLAVAHTNDYLEPHQIVAASGTLVLMAGIGATTGPIGAALLMDWIGPDGLLLWCALTSTGISLFALWRMTQRAAKPLEEQGTYVGLPVRPTPQTVAWVEGTGDAAAENPLPAAEPAPSGPSAPSADPLPGTG